MNSYVDTYINFINEVKLKTSNKINYEDILALPELKELKKIGFEVQTNEIFFNQKGTFRVHVSIHSIIINDMSLRQYLSKREKTNFERDFLYVVISKDSILIVKHEHTQLITDKFEYNIKSLKDYANAFKIIVNYYYELAKDSLDWDILFIENDDTINNNRRDNYLSDEINHMW